MYLARASQDLLLTWTSKMGSTPCVEKLLDAGADPNRVEFNDSSPLH